MSNYKDNLTSDATHKNHQDIVDGNANGSNHQMEQKKSSVENEVNNSTEENNSDEIDDSNNQSSADVTKNLADDDFSEVVSNEDKETIKEVASDDNFSAPKSYASILVEQFMDAKETFNRSLGSLFTSAFTAGLEIGISLFVILTAFALLSDVLPSQYAIVLSSLLYPIGFIIVVIGQSLLFTEQTSLLSLPVLNKIEPLWKLLRLWGIVIAGNIVGGCLFAALMIGLGINMKLFSIADVDAYAQHVLGYEWWVIFGSSILAGWMMGVAAWLVTSARDTISRIVLVSLITGSIGFLGLHHSIVGNIEVFSALLYGDSVSLGSYLLFLLVVLVGNTIGGVVFVAVLKNRIFLFEIKKVKQQTEDGKNDSTARMNARQR
ncbi:formate/nitrite transporter FocA (FNT family) [Psychrobacter sp. PL15]|uniref:formate/nitrite transporter family protein n=1 Tax=Psychrobacter sp. PL15 TaxID=3071719 RepID=UPI002E090DBB|nr:formate/nitrite transporter FocA (FNT family) [Psychrobacter sp. PL15]